MSQPGIPASTLPEEPLLDHVIGLARRADGVEDLVKFPVPALREQLEEQLLADINTAIAAGVDAKTAGAVPNILYASTADALSSGVAGSASLVGGSGGSNGTFNVAFSGGGGTGATALFTVAGGAVVDILFTSRGKNYTSQPAMSFAASSGLTGASAIAVISQNQPNGSFFYVYSSGEDLFILYENVGGSAVERGRVPSRAFIVAISDLAKAWASQPQGEDVAGAPPGGRSSFHWSKIAEAHKDAAAVSATNGSTIAAIVAANMATTNAAKDVAVAAAAMAGGAAIGNVPVKALVDVATTRPLTSFSGLQVVDGVQTVIGTRVFEYLQPNPALNGIYVAASGAWARAADADEAAKISGMVVIVRDGDTHWGRQFNCISNVLTLGTDPIRFELANDGGGNLVSMARQATGVCVRLGDSISISPGAHNSYMSGRGAPNRGPWRDWTFYRMADSGYQLAGLVASIATGNRSATPTHYLPGATPQWSQDTGGIWSAINALNQHPNSILEIRLGPNDFAADGTASRVPGGTGDPVVFDRNWRRAISLILATTSARIVLLVPNPLAGHADFGLPTRPNITQWAVDSPDGTIATGAATATAKMLAGVRKWQGRNPRVDVVDMPRQVYGGDRCDDPTTELLDPGTGAVFNNISIPATLRRQIFDSLHPTDLAMHREEETLMRVYGLSEGRARPFHYFVAGTRLDFTKIAEGEFVYFSGLANNGGNTLLTMRGSPENLFWRGSIMQTLFGNTPGPRLDIMAEAERSLFMKRLGTLRRLIDNYRRQIKVWFPATDAVYTISDISLSNTVIDGDALAERQYVLTLVGANMASELAAAQGPAVGYPSALRNDQWRQICLIYVENMDFAGPRWNIDLKIPGGKTQDTAPVWMTDASGEFRIASTFRVTRADNSVPTLGVVVSISNQSDGRFSEIINSKTGCSISGTALTTPNGTGLAPGVHVSGTGVSANTFIMSGSGTDWVVNNSQTVGPVSMTFTANFAPASIKSGVSIAGTTMTTPDGTDLAIGHAVIGPGVSASPLTTITAGSGTSWTVTPSQTVAGPISAMFGRNFAQGEGMPIGSVTFANGVQTATWVPNHVNINFMIAAGLWQGAANSGWVTLKHGAHLRAKASSAPTEGVTVVISN